MKFRTPLLFHSKRLCISLLYLFTTFAFAIYSSLFNIKCIIQSAPLDLIRHPLFTYPSTYGEHKYAISTVHTCNSPVFFSDYAMVLKEIEDFCMNSWIFSPALTYMAEAGSSFGGNFDTQRRKSYFDHRDDDVEVPCGFMQDFPLSDSDRLAMKDCRGVVVASVIFGDYDKIRQPRGLARKTLEIVCFFMFVDDSTMAALHSHNVLIENRKVGAWRIVRVSGKLPYENPAMNGVIPKHLIHRLFPKSKFSIWVDAKLQLTVDPLLLIHSLIISENADMALSKHPYNIHTIQEAMSTARWKKWEDNKMLKLQMETYCENGLQPWTPDKLPYTTDVPDTALIIRKHSNASNLMSCLLFNELEAFNPRDQLAFAYVRDLMRPKIKINMFEVEAFEHIAVEYRHNLKRAGGGGTAAGSPNGQKKIRAGIPRAVNGSKCEGYLLKMWDESRD